MRAHSFALLSRTGAAQGLTFRFAFKKEIRSGSRMQCENNQQWKDSRRLVSGVFAGPHARVARCYEDKERVPPGLWRCTPRYSDAGRVA